MAKSDYRVSWEEVEPLINQAKNLIGSRTDKALADALNTSAGAISGWRLQRSAPAPIRYALKGLIYELGSDVPAPAKPGMRFTTGQLEMLNLCLTKISFRENHEMSTEFKKIRSAILLELASRLEI